ncbi:DUF4145 domain-containing protein [Cupriavidus necator H16]|nr:DUF4145 domain-containing protein [Cupriavidus necator H16]
MERSKYRGNGRMDRIASTARRIIDYCSAWVARPCSTGPAVGIPKIGDGRTGADGKEQIYHPRTVTTFPTPQRVSRRPEWLAKIEQIDAHLSQILHQTYIALEADAFILASVGLRTAFDRTTEILKLDPGHTLEQKVALLKDKGYIGETEAAILSVVTDAGNAAAHRGWSPGAAEFRVLLIALEQFIERTVIQGTTALGIAQHIPPRHPRPKRAFSGAK